MTVLLCVMLLLQTSPSMLGLLLQAALAILVPIGGTWLAGQATKLWPAIAGWKDWEKRVLFTGYALVIAGISHALGLTLPEAWGALGTVEFQAILGSLGAMLLHRVLNPTPATP